MHSPMAAQILMRKGKRGAARHVQAECSRTADPQHLKELLNTLLNPQKPIDDLETVDWIKWLIAGGKNPPDFASTGNFDVLLLFTTKLLTMILCFIISEEI